LPIASLSLLLILPGLLLLGVLYHDLRDLCRLLSLDRARRAAPPPRPPAADTGEPQPTVDIVIPVYNMGASFRRTLASVERSNYPNRKIIVVDDGSDDGRTWPILTRLKDRIDRLERMPHGGKAQAANYGATLSDGEIILILDADSTVVPDFIEQALAELAEGCDAVDFVQQVANPEETWWTRWAAFEREWLELAPDNFGALFAVRRRWFENAPFQDCRSPQFEINHRLRAFGKLRISPRKVVYSDEPATLRRAYRRKRRWVYGFLESGRRHGAPLGHHILLPFVDVFLLGLVLAAPAVPALGLFPAALWLAWTAKAGVLGRRFGIRPATALTYPVFMLMLCVAAVEATVRFFLNRRVAWV
jgi:cellulose synthase/poly-beta-1,6-N-acetylglucosamine synthase-like glycosyltransferase